MKKKSNSSRVYFNCAHTRYVQQTPSIITSQAADEGSEDPLGVGPSTSYMCTVQKYYLFKSVLTSFHTPRP